MFACREKKINIHSSLFYFQKLEFDVLFWVYLTVLSFCYSIFYFSINHLFVLFLKEDQKTKKYYLCVVHPAKRTHLLIQIMIMNFYYFYSLSCSIIFIVPCYP